MAEIFDTLLLLALPASGKSEVRAYLTAKDPEAFHMGPTVQLDDYPYVHLQLRVDEALEKLGHARPFHYADHQGQRNGPFEDPRELGGLVELLSEDYREAAAGRVRVPENPTEHLLRRFDAASEAAGARSKFRDLPSNLRTRLAADLDPEVRAFYEKRAAELAGSLDGCTLVIEFARGGPAVDEMPLPEGYGYAGSLKHLDPELLERACILYIWVTPDDARRKNRERARPDGHGSILFHGTPESVMDQEYGRCDMRFLLETSDVPDTVRVERDGRVFYLPMVLFDNRRDLTTFLRKPEAEWTDPETQAIHGQLREACDRLWAVHRARPGA